MTIIEHEPVNERLNQKKETKRFRVNPLAAFISHIARSEDGWGESDVGRYLQTFTFYSLSVARFLGYIPDFPVDLGVLEQPTWRSPCRLR